jgi:site-specific DNA-methyltransferase (adenine-specific)
MMASNANIDSAGNFTGMLAGRDTMRKNTHPTVKPCDLMQYLVRLVTPKDGIVLDPFNGSGSTGKATIYENKDRDANYTYIGIELSSEYLEVSDARISYVLSIPTQYKLF